MAVTNFLENRHLDNNYYQPKRFKIGLDYGTTYSAGAFSLHSGSTQHLISGEIYPFYGYKNRPYPSKSKNTELPSDIRYEKNQVTKVGFDASAWPSSSGRLVRRAKLGLDQRLETESARRKLLQDLESLPEAKSPIEVISDYLSELFGLFKLTLTDVGYDSRDSIEINCTVPSIWDYTARQHMAGAIERAGKRSGLSFDPFVRLWPEAEAVAEHVLAECPNICLKKNHTFIVCNGGGGIVDITTFAVENVEPLYLREVVERSGALCGSSFIDERFYHHIDARIRACSILMEAKNETSVRKQLDLAVEQFRNSIKPTFDGLLSDTNVFPIHFSGLPVDESNGFFEDELQVERELFPIFDGIADEVWGCLKRQLQQAQEGGHLVQNVIFTGGLSGSPFLRRYLKGKLAAESSEIELIHAPAADFSVASGAIRCSFKLGENSETRRIS